MLPTASSQSIESMHMEMRSMNRLIQLLPQATDLQWQKVLLQRKFFLFIFFFPADQSSFFCALFIFNFPLLLSVVYTNVKDPVPLHSLSEILPFAGCNSQLISVSSGKDPLIRLHIVNEIPFYAPRRTIHLDCSDNQHDPDCTIQYRNCCYETFSFTKTNEPYNSYTDLHSLLQK